MLGLPDQDYLDGGAGDDVLLGFDYDDVLLGGEGADQLLGDGYPAPCPSFNDTYPVAQGGRPVGADYLDGGEATTSCLQVWATMCCWGETETTSCEGIM